MEGASLTGTVILEDFPPLTPSYLYWWGVKRQTREIIEYVLTHGTLYIRMRSYEDTFKLYTRLRYGKNVCWYRRFLREVHLTGYEIELKAWREQ
jgi:hypothetical protein